MTDDTQSPGMPHQHVADRHAGHSHAISADADRPELLIALWLIVGFMCVEVVVGILANSLALISDAGHMLTDAGAIAFALVAARLAQRPEKGSFTFGLKRAEILSAQLNGVTLLVLGLWIVFEGVRHLIDPPATKGLPVLIVALVGVAVNLIATMTLSRANRESLNIEGAYQHILTDLAAFVATAIAGAAILITGFERADGIAAILVAVLMLHSAYVLLRDSGRVLMEAAPKGLSPDAIGSAMAAEPEVSNVHDLHIWEVTSGFPALSAHVMVSPGSDCHMRRRLMERMLQERFGIDHTTLQVDHEHETQLLTVE